VEYEAKWADIAGHLESLSAFVGTPELAALLKSEIAKILQQVPRPATREPYLHMGLYGFVPGTGHHS